MQTDADRDADRDVAVLLDADRDVGVLTDADRDAQGCRCAA